jgi:hypothetical protein
MTFSRLDYIFVSSEVTANIKTAKVDWAFESSDHAAVIINVKLNTETIRGPGTVKINVNILNNPDTVNVIRNELEIALNQADKSWNPHVRLEYLKVMIRSIFASQTSRERKDIRNELEDREKTLNQMQDIKIKTLVRNTNATTADQDQSRYESVVKSIEYLSLEITKFRNKLSETMAFISKAKWYEKGEKSNKFFLNLNTMRHSQKLISNIRDDSEEYVGQVGVMKCVRNFYESLYEKKACSEGQDDSSFYENCPKLTEQNKVLMEQELTISELKEALMSCKASSPGPDGIPYEVYKRFWSLTGPIIYNSWKYSLQIGSLAPSQLESTIVLLPKTGKDCKDIKNWRPITLSNCDLKIITKAIASRMAKVLDQIIVNSQTAYIPGRSVMDNLRTNYYFKQYCKKNKQNAVLISLDAKKAFDSVDHKYIENTLIAYGFGPNLINTFIVLYNKITARILVNGFQSESIKIERGVKQGDALSCAIFIICIDPLIRNIEKNCRIEPIVINKMNNRGRIGIEFKAAAYADDISVICRNSQESIQQVFNEYSRLTKRSGLELNAEKTEILRLDGNNQFEINIEYGGSIHRIKSVTKIKICGLFYCQNHEEEYQLNVRDKIEKLTCQIRKWSHNQLTMEGKNLIVKTFGLSQMIYNMQVYDVKEKELVQVERIIFAFMWSTSKNANGIDRIKRSIMKNSFSNGGLNVTDVDCLDRALKTRQFIRASNSNHPIAKVQAYLTNSNINDSKIKNEYANINTEETICSRALSTINVLTDYYRSNITSEESEQEQVVNNIASIKIRTFLKRKNLLLHLCVLKPLTDASIETLGELCQEYEHNQDPDICQRIKIVMGAIPGNFKQILENINDNTICDDNLKLITLEDNSRKEIEKVTTKEFQCILKKALNKIDVPNFSSKLRLNQEFPTSCISETRIMCKNIKLRSIYFRLIHNDFYTKVKMKKFKMIESDECLRCGNPETTRHLLWDCHHANNIWTLFNNLLINIGSPQDSVKSYDELYCNASSAAITTLKLKIIQELIQIDRPTNWNKEIILSVILEIIKIEKYISLTNNNLKQYNNKWNSIEDKIYKYKFLSA